MEVTNLLDIHTREELYAWHLENSYKASDLWLRVYTNMPLHPAAPTIYGWVREGLIPLYKQGKGLFFKKSEIYK